MEIYFYKFSFNSTIPFFLFTCPSLFFFRKSKRGAFSIEVKLSFFFIPILFAVSRFNKVQFHNVLLGFIAANAMSSVICIVHSLLHYFNQADFLYYNEFCLFMHPSYFSMYLVFSLIALIIKRNELFWIKDRFYMFLIFCLLISVSIFFSSSKMGILTLFLLLPILILLQLYRNKNFKIIGVVIAVSILSGIFFLQSESGLAARMKNALQFVSNHSKIDKTTSESNAVRKLIWDEAIQLIKEKPVLQTGIGLGLIGIIVLAITILFPIWSGIKTKNDLTVFFGILIVLNFAVESMLQTSAGTLFFVFFYSLLILNKQQLLKKNPFKFSPVSADRI